MKNLVSYEELYTLIEKSYNFLEQLAANCAEKLRQTLKLKHFEVLLLASMDYIGSLYEDCSYYEALEEFVHFVNNNTFNSVNAMLESVDKQKDVTEDFGVVYFIFQYRHDNWQDDAEDAELENQVYKLGIPHDDFSSPIEPLICEYIFYKSKGVDVDTLEKQLSTRLKEMFKLPYGVDYINQYGDNLGNLDGCCEEYLTQLAING